MQPQNRRCFVKRSLASSAAVGAPAFFTGLIRAHGEGGETTTTDPWETTGPGTTEPWETTAPDTTSPDTTSPWETSETAYTTTPLQYDINERMGNTGSGPSSPLRHDPAWASDYFESDHFAVALPAGLGNLEYKLKAWFDPVSLLEPGGSGNHVDRIKIKFHAELFGQFPAASGSPYPTPGWLVLQTEMRELECFCNTSNGFLTTTEKVIAPASGIGNVPFAPPGGVPMLNTHFAVDPATGDSMLLSVTLEDVSLSPSTNNSVAISLSGLVRVMLGASIGGAPPAPACQSATAFYFDVTSHPHI